MIFTVWYFAKFPCTFTVICFYYIDKDTVHVEATDRTAETAVENNNPETSGDCVTQ